MQSQIAAQSIAQFLAQNSKFFAGAKRGFEVPRYSVLAAVKDVQTLIMDGRFKCNQDYRVILTYVISAALHTL